MDIERIAAILQTPQVQRKILKNYHGAYSLGLALHPASRNQVAIRVSIEGKGRGKIPSEINLDGEIIPVIVSENFIAPEPLQS